MSGNRGLGKGLDALLKGYQAEPSSIEVKVIPVSSIEPNPYQPRREFSEKALQDLAESISTQGVLQPILVRHHPSKKEGAYELVAGERRWRASQLAKKESIPALIRELSDEESLAIALIENLQREDLNPIEEALGLRQLQQQFNMNQETLAARIGKSRSGVANTLRLLHLPEDIQMDIKQGRLSAGHARSLLSVSDPLIQNALRNRILDPGLTVRETEAQVNFWKEHGVLPDANTMAVKPPKGKRSVPQVAEPLLVLQEQLSLSTRMKVKFKGSEDKGQIVLKYTSREQLEGLKATLGINAED